MKNLILIFTLLTGISIQAQYRVGLIPRVSPTTEILNTIGYTEVEVHYSSPSVNNRKIWGDLVPYNDIWRAGANEATKISFSKPVHIGNQKVEAGSYSLFIIPREHGKWTIILNQVADQWGAFSYDRNKDVIRMDILPRFNISYEEKLRYEIVDIGFEYGIIRMQWENVELEIEFMTYFDDHFLEKIQATVDTLQPDAQWAVYLQGAEFLAERKQRLDTALIWADKAETGFTVHDHPFKSNESYFLGHIYWVKALVNHHLEDNDKSIFFIDRVKAIDKGNGYYNRSNNRSLIDEVEEKIRTNSNKN